MCVEEGSSSSINFILFDDITGTNSRNEHDTRASLNFILLLLIRVREGENEQKKHGHDDDDEKYE
jgi:hypothetical protein